MTPQNPLDVAILFALKEEFEELEKVCPEIKSSQRPDSDQTTGRTFLLFDYPAGASHAYRCVVSFVGSMGAQSASFITQFVVNRYSPRTIILVGLAGSLSDDVLIGDVVIAEQVDDYIQDAKYGDQGFSLAGQVYRANARLINVVRFFEVTQPDVWKNINESCVEDVRALIPNLTREPERSLFRLSALKLHIGHIASGPIVAAASEFREWLRRRDRKLLAIEMEAAGVMNAIYHGAGDQRVLVLRGISDISDAKKSFLDRVGDGSLRRLAMRNSLRLLMALLRAGVLERANGGRSRTFKWLIWIFPLLMVSCFVYWLVTRPPKPHTDEWKWASSEAQEQLNWYKPESWQIKSGSQPELTITGPDGYWGGPREFDDHPLHDFVLQFTVSFPNGDSEPGTKLIWVVHSRPHREQQPFFLYLSSLDGYRFKLQTDTNGNMSIDKVVIVAGRRLTEIARPVGLHCCSSTSSYHIRVRILGRHQDNCIWITSSNKKNPDLDVGQRKGANFEEDEPRLSSGSIAFGSGKDAKEVRISDVYVQPLLRKNTPGIDDTRSAEYKDEMLSCDN